MILLCCIGSGFIGSNFIRYLLSDGGVDSRFKGRVGNLDKLTYAGNPLNLVDIEEKYGNCTGEGRYVLVYGDICDTEPVDRILSEYQIDRVVNLAAENHVDRSKHGPAVFIRTNILGTFTLLETEVYF